jgi:hypothetical protein
MTATKDFNRYAWQRRPLIPNWPAKNLQTPEQYR